MSKDETGNTESQGIPGFSANNSIPGGFALPIPTATAGAAQPDEAPADPWSSTWEDTSWQSGDTGAIPTVAAGDAASASDDWTASYEYGGETAAHDTSERNGYAQNGSAVNGADTSDASSSTSTTSRGPPGW